MKRFLVPNSARDVSSLSALKTLLNSKQVTTNVNKCFYAASLFLDKVLDGYLKAYEEKFSAETGTLHGAITKYHATRLLCVNNNKV